MKREPLRILVAEHERAARHALKRQLHEAGHRVQTASSGEDVILLCDIDPPDVLIVDVQLPDMDGFEVCEHVRHETRHLDLIVIMMAEPTNDMTRTYLGQMVEYAGGDYFFAKPLDSRLVAKLVDELANENDAVEEHNRAGFPTRVVWPTRHQRIAVSAG